MKCLLLYFVGHKIWINEQKRNSLSKLNSYISNGLNEFFLKHLSEGKTYAKNFDMFFCLGIEFWVKLYETLLKYISLSFGRKRNLILKYLEKIIIKFNPFLHFLCKTFAEIKRFPNNFFGQKSEVFLPLKILVLSLASVKNSYILSEKVVNILSNNSTEKKKH